MDMSRIAILIIPNLEELSLSGPADSKLRRNLWNINSLLKKSIFIGCSKMPRCKASEILRSEAYLDVRRNDEG